MTGQFLRATPSHGLGVACVLSAGVFASLAGILVRAVESADVWQILFWRSLSFTVVIAAFVFLRRRGDTVRAFRAIGVPGLIVAGALGGAFVAFILALVHTTVANTVFVLSAAPLFAAALARLVLGERVRRSTGLAMVVVFAGVALMVGSGLAGGHLAGNLWALAAALGFAVTLVALRHGRAVDMTPATCLAGVVALGVSAAFVPALAIGSNDLAVALALGTVQVGFQYILITIGSRHVPAAEVALLSLVEVALAPLWVWIGVGEVPDSLTLVGGALVIAAVGGQAVVRLRADPR